MGIVRCGPRCGGPGNAEVQTSAFAPSYWARRPVSRRRLLRLLGAAAVVVPVALTAHRFGPHALAAGVPPQSPTWLQALRSTPLWSGPDATAVRLDTARQWDYLRLSQPQRGPRLAVMVARTGGPAWADAADLGPSGPPPPGWPPADADPEASSAWVASDTAAPLWADVVGTLPLGVAPAWTPFQQLAPQQGSRLPVQDPYAGQPAYVDVANVGPIGAPGTVGTSDQWWGSVVVDGANVRTAASSGAMALGRLAAGRAVVVSGWVAGQEVVPDNPAWAQLGDGAYMYSSVLTPVPLVTPPTPPPDAPTGVKWIDLNLTLQTVVAYEGRSPVRLARTSTGRPGWETSRGIFRIVRRVPSETMDSGSLLGLDASRASYHVDHVRWTQYFTADGEALHENYWKPREQFGIPSSHGCAGLVAEDATFFWDWASVGTPVYSHL